MFVTIEGIDGTGKTTVANRVVTALQRQGRKAVYARSPSGSIRDMLLNKDFPLSRRAQFFLFNADQQMMYDDCSDFLRSGGIVICDRFSDSTWVYQYKKAIQEDMPVVSLMAMNTVLRYLLPQPDLTIVLDVNYETAMARRSDGKSDRFEVDGCSEWERRRSAYLNLTEELSDRKFFVVSTDGKTIDAVVQEVMGVLSEYELPDVK